TGPPQRSEAEAHRSGEGRLWGHAEPLPPTRWSGCCRFGQETFVRTQGNGRDVPKAAVCRTAVEPRGSTPETTPPDPAILGLLSKRSSAPDGWTCRRRSRELVEQRFGLLQILRREALGEPAVDGREQCVRLADPVVLAHQPGVAGRGAQLPGFRLLRSRPVERGEVAPLRPCRIALQQKHPALDPEDFGIVIAFFPAGALDLCDHLVDESERPGEIADLGHALGQHGFPIGTVESASALLPGGKAPPEQSHPFAKPALPD